MRAMSSDCPNRPIGKVAPMSLAVSPSIPATARPSVSVMPGAVAFLPLPRQSIQDSNRL